MLTHYLCLGYRTGGGGGGSGRLALQPPRESTAHRTESDEYYLLDDPKVHGKSKMKKAFCEPGNVDFCLPIEVFAYFGGLENGKTITISRSPDNIGDVTTRKKPNCYETLRQGHSILVT